MEHIIQFGVTVDDDKIEKLITEQASKALIEQVENFNKRSYYEDGNLDRMFREEVKRFIDYNKDILMDKAVKKVVDDIKHSRKYQEALKTCIAEME